ncbi:MAG: type II toxin-antitoxin system RelE/ParE family toxin [Flavobacterium sp.]
MVRRARKTVWTVAARESRISIFLYWNKRNKSTSYSRKLNQLFQEALKQIETFPKSSIELGHSDVRLKVASHFEIIYQISDTQITILDIWDTRQNPQNFPIK